MTSTASGFMHFDGQNLTFARDLREALAVYARRQWPLNTSGNAAQAWKLPKSTVANLLKGHASDATVTAVLRAGGWPLALSVVGATIGQSLEDHLTSERKRIADERATYEAREAQLASMEAHLRERRTFAGSGHREAAVRHRRQPSAARMGSSDLGNQQAEPRGGKS